MPWTKVTFQRDTDNPRIGTCSATFDDGAGFTFDFGARVDEQDGLATFITKAKAALASEKKQRGEVDVISAKILAALNK